MRLTHLSTPRLLLAIALLLANSLVQAAELATLTLLPEICVVDQSESHCKTVLTIKYSTPNIGNYCVLIKSHNIRKCYQQVKHFEMTLDFISEKDVEIAIENQHSRKVINQETMHVVHYKAKTRRRRNLGWSFL